MVSFDFANLAQYKRGGAFPPNYPTSILTFWAGMDRVHEVLIAAVGSAQHSLVISGYGYDDNELDSVVRSKLDADHIFVQISLDKSQAGGVHERAILAAWSPEDLTNSVAIGQSETHQINHLKTIIIDGVYRITGSTNWSDTGEGIGRKSQNNQMDITNDPVLAAEARSILDIQHLTMLRQREK